MNLVSRNKNALKLKVGFICCLTLFITSCENKYKDGFQQFYYKDEVSSYIDYVNLTKDELHGGAHAGDAYFFDIFDDNENYIAVTSYEKGDKNFGFPMEDGTRFAAGELVVKKGIYSMAFFPISIPVNIKETRSWIGPGPFKEKCSATYGKPDNDSVNINIECIEDSEPYTGIPGRDISKGIWNSKRGLTYYLTPEGSSICPMQLKSQNGLFSPKFFEYYRTKSREIAAKSKSGKPADVIPDIVY
jgi:hypothetical protein